MYVINTKRRVLKYAWKETHFTRLSIDRLERDLNEFSIDWRFKKWIPPICQTNPSKAIVSFD